ncbi:MAG: ribbon-helix-helix protein, CopG family [Gaiellaceae bacterium]
MKTAVSIPDALFRRTEHLAKRLGKSRSQVYQEALREYVARREPAPVTAALDEALEQLGDAQDSWLRASSRRALERSEW